MRTVAADRDINGMETISFVSCFGFSKKIIIAVVCILCGTIASSQNITYDSWQKLSTQELMPAEVKLRKSNNNLDVVQFKGRFYTAFRTAPSHFASSKTKMYVISSIDLKKWDFENVIEPGSDIREPRFAVWGDSLYLYCFKGGTKAFKFEPREVIVVASLGNKQWTSPASIGLDGYVPWRLRVHNSTLLLSAYYGKDLYNSKHQSDLRLFKSVDARHFVPVSKEPQLNVQTAEEGEFIFDKSGTLYAVVRLEGYGALVCRSEKDSIDKWKYVKTKHKYDSSLLFEHNNEIYLIARRNLDGACDRSGENKRPHRVYNLVRYSLTKKRTALFKLDKQSLYLKPLLDFPSTGDCSFAGIQKLNDSDYLVMNYSSEITKKEKIWLRGQYGKTFIYWTILHMK